MSRWIVFFAWVFIPGSSANAESLPGFQKVVEAFVDGRYTGVDTLFRSLQERSNSASVQGCIWYWQGRFEDWRGEPDRAFEWFEKAVQEDSVQADYHYWLGLMYGDKAKRAAIFKKPGYARSSKKAFEKAVEVDPDHHEARQRLVDYHVHAPGILGGSKKEARAQAEQIMARDVSRGHLAWAAIHSNEKAIEEVEASYRAAYQSSPDDATPLLWLSAFLNQNKRRQEAVILLEGYLRAHPDESWVLYNLSALYLLDKQYGSAFDAASRSLQRIREALKTRRADPEIFSEDFEDVLLLQSRRRDVLYRVGLISALAGQNLEEGIASLNVFFDILPPGSKSFRANGYYQLGRIYLHQEQEDRAREAFELALRWNKEHKGAKKALQKLK